MMDISKPANFYKHFEGKLLRIVFKDGKEWVGMVTDVAGYDKKTQDFFDATLVVFTRIKWLKGYFKKIPLFRGRRRLLSIEEIVEIHQLP